MIRALLYSEIQVKNHRAQVTVYQGGVVYEVLTPMSDFEWCHDDPQGYRRLEIYHHITEQGQSLFGFETNEARNIFVDLITEVEGMGCTKALKVMSAAEPEKLVVDIADGDLEALTKVDGIGPKSAERIIATLKDRYAQFSTKKDLGKVTRLTMMDMRNSDISEELRTKFQEMRETAKLVLVKLGYARRAAEAALDELDYRSYLQMQQPGFDRGLDMNEVLQRVIKASLSKIQAMGAK